jgi:hypothetical protein
MAIHIQRREFIFPLSSSRMVAARAQQQPSLPVVVGFLNSGSFTALEALTAAFRQGGAVNVFGATDHRFSYSR